MSKGAPWKAPRDEDCLDRDGLLVGAAAVLDGLPAVGVLTTAVASVALLALVSSVMVGDSVALHIVDVSVGCDSVDGVFDMVMR